MTDAELKSLVASLAVAQAENTKAQAENAKAQAETARVAAETSRELKETIKVVAETSRKVDALSKELKGLSDNIGYAAEDFFFNTLEETPVIGGVTFERATPKVLIGPKGKKTELDVVLVNGSAVAFVEVKHRPHLEHIEQIEAHVAKYRKHFPEHKDYKIYAGIGGMSMPPHVAAAAQERGLFVVQQVGRVIEVDAARMVAH